MTSRSYRVLWVTTSASWDGPGRALAALLEHWAPEDTIAVAVLKDADPAFRAAVRSRVEIQPFGMRGLTDLAAVRRLREFAEAWRPDIIHTQLSRADWIGRLVAHRLGVPVVSTIQNVHSRMYQAEFSPITSRVALALDRWTFRKTGRLLAVSNGVRADLLQHGARDSQVVVVANSFNPTRTANAADRDTARARLGAADGHVVVGTVALLKTQKGIRDLIDAAILVLRSNNRVRFVHVGGGPLEPDVRRWIADAGIGDRFRLTGWVADPLALLPGMDLFVLPSLWEGLPIALLEAMAAGLPAIGTRVAGIEEVIVDGVTGRLVPAHAPAGLASAILDLAASADERRVMGEAGRARLSAFDARPIARQVRQIYESVLAERMRPV
jgi:glycosyltransferase involved in cell wall biosynthesis